MSAVKKKLHFGTTKQPTIQLINLYCLNSFQDLTLRHFPNKVLACLIKNLKNNQ